MHYFLVKILIECATSLDKSQMIRYDSIKETFHSTQIGMIASHFYINHGTIDLFQENLRQIMSEKDILEIASQSSEFEQIKARNEEVDDLQKLYETHCYFKEHDTFEFDSLMKVKILTQTAISR